MELNHMDALLAQNKMINKQLADLTKKTHDPYSKTYNYGWRNHPNFGWGNQQDQGQDQRCHNHNPNNNATHQHPSQRSYQHPLNHPSQLSNLNPPSPTEDRLSRIETLPEDICKEVQDNRVFKDEVRANIKNQGDTIKRLESQVGYLSQQFSKPTDGFPSDTEKNSRGETKKVRWKEYKMITISDERSVEEVPTQTEHFQDNPKEKHEGRNQAPHPTHREELKKGETLNPYAPFPQRLKDGVAKRMYSRFLDMFASLDVNIPFIKALQQMPSYIKYIKELLAKKSSLKGGKTIMMNKECSALIQPEPPTKKKDPGTFHIPCAIGKTIIDKGLCDLGASINLMPLSLMKKL
ncbi:uncharacterized protein LOC130966259 [Arachis stenosperma]|uniref:uncharacterized protein LOC130966259 n=1 Tax=Arachis stenosperma TaxID=217475 RepID=UPI0025ACC00B|nr:uncharacterized protein LOC130966259 [Arachis stenosperma]